MAALFFKPAFGLILVTLRTGAIAAGVIGKHFLLAVIALIDWPPKNGVRQAEISRRARF